MSKAKSNPRFALPKDGWQANAIDRPPAGGRGAGVATLGEAALDRVKNRGFEHADAQQSIARFLEGLANPKSTAGLDDVALGKAAAVLVQLNEKSTGSSLAEPWRTEALPGALRKLLEQPNAGRKTLYQATILVDYLNPPAAAALRPLMDAVHQRALPAGSQIP